MSIFKNRKDSTEYLRAQGVVLGDHALAELASEGRGPKYVIINGRALSTEAWLTEWLQAQVSSAPRRGNTGRRAAVRA